MFSKRVENTVGKGEIARYEQFLLFPQCFQNICTTDTYKPELVWERVKRVFNKMRFASRLRLFARATIGANQRWFFETCHMEDVFIDCNQLFSLMQ